MPIAEGGEAPSTRPADGYERGGAKTAGERPGGRQEVRSGENPFKAIAEQVAVPLPARALATSVDLKKELDPSWASLGKLAAVESKLGADGAERLGKVRQGVMLVTADGQSARAVPNPEKLEAFARAIVEKKAAFASEDAKGFAKQYAAFLAVGERNIQAYVQAVLRESYLLGNDVLGDFADKVKFFNDVKKKIREEMKRAREVIAQMAGKDETTQLDTPFKPSDIERTYAGRTESEVTEHALTPEELEAKRAEDEKAARIGEMQKDYDAKVAEARAGATISGFDNVSLKRNYGSSEDLNSSMSEHVGAFLEALGLKLPEDPAAREALEKALEEGGLQVAIWLSDWQGEDNFYWTRSDGTAGYAWDPDLDGSGNYQRDGVSRDGDGRIMDGLGDPYSQSQWVTAPPKRPDQSLEEYLSDCVTEIANQFAAHVKNEEGDIEVNDIEIHANLPLVIAPELPEMPPELQEHLGGTHPDDPGEWSPGQPCETKAELQAYIERLEEDLNGTGDDAQLANVDLQNELQKQQQVMQMMSNISKMVHDTAMAIVRKVGG